MFLILNFEAFCTIMRNLQYRADVNWHFLSSRVLSLSTASYNEQIMSLTLEWFLIKSAYSLCNITDDTYWTYAISIIICSKYLWKDFCLFIVESAWKAYHNSNVIPITVVWIIYMFGRCSQFQYSASSTCDLDGNGTTSSLNERANKRVEIHRPVRNLDLYLYRADISLLISCEIWICIINYIQNRYFAVNSLWNLDLYIYRADISPLIFVAKFRIVYYICFNFLLFQLSATFMFYMIIEVFNGEIRHYIKTR